MCELEEYARAAPSVAEHGPDPMAEEDTESDDGEDSMRSGYGEDEDPARDEPSRTRIDADAETTGGDSGARRSGRQRLAPVDFWRGDCTYGPS